MIKPLLFYTVKRVFKLGILLVLVSLCSFILVSLSPIDPVNTYIGADMLQISEEQKTIIAQKWGLDEPLPVRFFKWAGCLLSGDFGKSTIFNEPVLQVIGKRFFTSLWLMIAAWTLSGVIGFFLGLFSAVYEKSLFERVISLYCYVLASTPVFWIAIVLLIVFAVNLGWAPVFGAVPPGVIPEEATLTERLVHMALPVMTLSLTGIAAICLHTYEKVKNIIKSDYILFAVSKGESRIGIAFHHALRNALLPAVSLQFASIGEIFGGAVLVEQVFAYPGLGKATVEAGVRGDVPLLLGIVLFLTLFIYTGNVVADILYRIIDPRIRTLINEFVYK
ncbi:MAG: ABC transporter permease [Spirochaetales bacterium]|nr:ABC transporter permease [Spirochaetales bacterium]